MENKIRVLFVITILMLCINFVFSTSYNDFNKSEESVNIGDNYYLFYNESNFDLVLRFVEEKYYDNRNIEEDSYGINWTERFHNRLQINPIDSINQWLDDLNGDCILRNKDLVPNVPKINVTMNYNADNYLFKNSSGYFIKKNGPSHPLSDLNLNLDNILQTNYYTKAKLTITIYGNGSAGEENTTLSKDVYLKPDNEVFNENIISFQDLLDYVRGSYSGLRYIDLTFEVVDNKCQNYQNGDSGDLKYNDITNYTFPIIIQTDNLELIQINDTEKLLDDYDKQSGIVVKNITSEKLIINDEIIEIDDISDIEFIEDDESKKITAKEIAYIAHKIEPLSNADDVEKLVSNIVETTNSVDINKISEIGTTTKNVTISLDLSSFDFADDANSPQKNIVVYQIFDKEELPDINQITFPEGTPDNFFVKDKDPVIGWYFEDPEGIIKYTLPIEAGGITIVVTDPILFNDGDLIVNYREGECNDYEANIFNIEKFVDSDVYPIDDTENKFKVCVGHMDYNLSNDDTINPFVNIFEYEDNNSQKYNATLSLTEDIPDLYWDVKFQTENPTGEYTCLGSVTGDYFDPHSQAPTWERF